MEEFNISFKPKKELFVQALLFVSFGKNKSLKKSRLLICGSALFLILNGINSIVSRNSEIGIFLTIMGSVFMIYGLFFLKSMRYKLITRKVDKFHYGLFDGDIAIKISENAISENAELTYSEYKNEAIASAYELKDQFVFLTKQGSLLSVPSSELLEKEKFRNHIKEWYSYENHFLWKW